MPNNASVDRAATLSGSSLVLVAAIGFSAKAIFVKLAYRYGVDAVTLLALRMLFASPFFILAAAWSQREDGTELSARQWISVFLLGLGGYYFASLFDFLGLKYVNASLERLVLFLYPSFVMLITVVRDRRPFARREGVALALSYTGIAFVFLQDVAVEGSNVPLGTALVFASALAYATYLVGSAEMLRSIGTLKFTAYAMLVCCTAGVAQFAVGHPLSTLEQPWQVYALGGSMALCSPRSCRRFCSLPGSVASGPRRPLCLVRPGRLLQSGSPLFSWGSHCHWFSWRERPWCYSA